MNLWVNSDVIKRLANSADEIRVVLQAEMCEIIDFYALDYLFLYLSGDRFPLIKALKTSAI